MTNKTVNTTVTGTNDQYNMNRTAPNNVPNSIRIRRFGEGHNKTVIVNISTAAKCDKIHQDIVVITR